ncbi:MAG: 8-amino-7-oxononanoate synthase [Fibromonadaceae bacterium]|jgi:8-amino-7-oxononanoate synthase|nr:8-amino-7-oxononanoate synthase [Fibromonadaceae bacterium]
MQQNFENIIASKLAEKRKNGMFRFLSQPKGLDFSNNDYLGLANHFEIAKAAADAYIKLGAGSKGSRLLGGNHKIFEETESWLAKWKGTEAALIFNNGYNANLGIISAFCDSKTHLFCDRLSHTSILDGYAMSSGKLHRFKHNDPADLEKALQKVKEDEFKLIAVEAIYSMDGDIAPLKEYAELAEKYGAMLYVDEAHSDGILGPGGKGLIAELDLEAKVHLSLTTFGKAYGTMGACIFGSKLLIDYIINNARSFIYSTAISPGTVAAIQKAVEVSARDSFRRESVLRVSADFRQRVREAGFNCLQSETQIVPIVLGTIDKALKCRDFLAENGFHAACIRPPTVPNGTARLRINISAAHKEEDVKRLAETLARWDK